MSMGAGSISDIFEAEDRGRAFAYYTTGPMLGPALAYVKKSPNVQTCVPY